MRRKTFSRKWRDDTVCLWWESFNVCAMSLISSADNQSCNSDDIFSLNWSELCLSNKLQITITSWTIFSLAVSCLAEVEEGERQGEKENKHPSNLCEYHLWQLWSIFMHWGDEGGEKEKLFKLRYSQEKSWMVIRFYCDCSTLKNQNMIGTRQLALFILICGCM